MHVRTAATVFGAATVLQASMIFVGGISTSAALESRNCA
jgi:hypothetical protein